MGIHSGVAEEVSTNRVTKRRTYGGKVMLAAHMFHKYTGTGDNSICWRFVINTFRSTPPTRHIWKLQLITAHHSTAQRSTSHRSTAQHSTPQHIVAHHSTAPHSTAHYSTASHGTAYHYGISSGSTSGKHHHWACRLTQHLLPAYSLSGIC